MAIVSQHKTERFAAECGNYLSSGSSLSSGAGAASRLTSRVSTLVVSDSVIFRVRYMYVSRRSPSARSAWVVVVISSPDWKEKIVDLMYCTSTTAPDSLHFRLCLLLWFLFHVSLVVIGGLVRRDHELPVLLAVDTEVLEDRCLLCL